MEKQLTRFVFREDLKGHSNQNGLENGEKKDK